MKTLSDILKTVPAVTSFEKATALGKELLAFEALIIQALPKPKDYTADHLITVLIELIPDKQLLAIINNSNALFSKNELNHWFEPNDKVSYILTSIMGAAHLKQEWKSQHKTLQNDLEAVRIAVKKKIPLTKSEREDLKILPPCLAAARKLILTPLAKLEKELEYQQSKIQTYTENAKNDTVFKNKRGKMIAITDAIELIQSYKNAEIDFDALLDGFKKLTQDVKNIAHLGLWKQLMGGSSTTAKLLSQMHQELVVLQEKRDGVPMEDKLSRQCSRRCSF